ncbi:uncharacterized protein FRV6_14234 [Fusarium oxysporum]|uniref:Uncharacterized protein n=1 Tax=Fusarium oxysporum TaxID=5507 RepID=A0A2H3U3P2_FUSOX|nr:uncharacterized protein FRV6_14234 [Fusarium oxysporum]
MFIQPVKRFEIQTKDQPFIKESLSSNNFSHMDDNLPHDGRAGLISRLGKVSISLLMSLFVRSIVLAGWTTRSITITSLVLRWATAAKAATCTSMLAAILLQKGAVPLPAATAVSIFRFDNTGPWSLLGKMRGEWHHGSVSVGLLATLLTFTSFSLQFTPTVVLSQVGIASLPVATSVPQTYYYADPDGPSFRFQMSQSHSFLETTHHGELAPYSAPGIRDTGTVMRALLPLKENDERSRLIEYHEFGTVVDTRVVCMRPKLTTVVYSDDRVTGLADVEQKPLGLLRQPGEDGSKNYSLSFDCAFRGATGDESETYRYGWSLALCRLIQPEQGTQRPEKRPTRLRQYRKNDQPTLEAARHLDRTNRSISFVRR